MVCAVQLVCGSGLVVEYLVLPCSN